MKQSQGDIKQVQRYCDANGIRLTEKRKCVLYCLLRSSIALSAYDISDRCQSHFHQAITTMSVYRILAFLESEQLVHKLNLTNKYVACSHITCKHSNEIPQFVICDRCQVVNESSISQEMMSMLTRHLPRLGFTLSRPQIELSGLCALCADEKSSATTN